MRYCPSCARDVEIDVIPAKTYGGVTVPPFTICIFCGWWLDDQEVVA
jgi:hypothetical protein